jgi:hypothetical protein
MPHSGLKIVPLPLKGLRNDRCSGTRAASCAYHCWMADYCGAYPNRLGGVILAGARDVDGALAEIHRWGRSSWAWGRGRRQGRIVTGDASGIGAACAMTLAREGAKVVVTDMDDPGGQAVVDKIRAPAARRSTFIRM